MRKYVICITGFVGSALLQTGCYDNRRNYDYHDVNTMAIMIPEVRVHMPREEAVEIPIIPEVSQTLEQNEENLAFQWKKTIEGKKAESDRLNDYKDYSVDEECKVVIEPYESENIGLMLVITDKRNGTTWYQIGEVAIIRPLDPYWFVLQEKEGEGVLGAIEGIPERYYVYPGVFKLELNRSFPLERRPLVVSAGKNYGDSSLSSMLDFFGFKVSPTLTVVTDRGLTLLTPSTLITRYPSDKILFEPVGKGELLNIEFYKTSTHGGLFANSGKAYCTPMGGFCVLFSVEKESEFPAISAYGSYGGSFLFFDSESHHFLNASIPGYYDYMMNQATQNIRNYNTKRSDQRPISTYSMSNEPNLLDPDVIDPSLEIHDIVTGGNWGNFAYAIASPRNGRELTTLRFSTQDEDSICATQYMIALPSEVNVETAKFTVSYTYTTNLIFVASGNKLHRIDLDREKAIELYTYETDPSAQIAALKFKDSENVREEDDDEGTGEYKGKLGMSLGLGIDTADKGVVVELQLTVAGDVSREENGICVYEDPGQPVGKVVDINYNYK